MRKGYYPASEYYGPPTPPPNEVVESVKSVNHKPSPHRVEERDSLRESFVTKIDFVTDLWKKVEDPSMADLPLTEFKNTLSKLYFDLGKIVPNWPSIQGEYKKITDEITAVSSAVECETIKRRKDGGQDTTMMGILEEKLAQARERLTEKLCDPNFEFVHHFASFLSGIYLKKTKLEPLRVLSNFRGVGGASLSFLESLKPFNFESEYGVDSNYSITVSQKISRLLEFLKESILNGKNIFDFIEINSYDICFFLDREDFDKINGEGGGDNTDSNLITNGIHFSKTPIILMAKDEDRDMKEMERVKRHEQGHNLIEIVGNPDNFDIHNIVYKKSFLNGLNRRSEEFKDLYDQGKIADAELIVREYMQTAINKLNGEISADAKNIVLSYPKVFAVYVKDLTSYLDTYVSKFNDVELGDSEKMILDVFLNIVKEEIEIMKKRAVDLFVEITTYAYMARKHGLEDEFCSALILMPDSAKYLKRLFEVRLGDKFDFVKANMEIDPDKLFVGAPSWLIQSSFKYFGSNSIIVDKSKIDKSENPPSQGR